MPREFFPRQSPLAFPRGRERRMTGYRQSTVTGLCKENGSHGGNLMRSIKENAKRFPFIFYITKSYQIKEQEKS